MDIGENVPILCLQTCPVGRSLMQQFSRTLQKGIRHMVAAGDPGIFWQQLHNGFAEHAFTAAGFAYDAQHFPGMQTQTHIVYRVDRACELLRATALPVTEIALRCGFGSASYFGKLFRARMGSSPTAYRRAHAGASGGC